MGQVPSNKKKDVAPRLVVNADNLDFMCTEERIFATTPLSQEIAISYETRVKFSVNT